MSKKPISFCYKRLMEKTTPQVFLHAWVGFSSSVLLEWEMETPSSNKFRITNIYLTRLIKHNRFCYFVFEVNCWQTSNWFWFLFPTSTSSSSPITKHHVAIPAASDRAVCCVAQFICILLLLLWHFKSLLQIHLNSNLGSGIYRTL